MKVYLCGSVEIVYGMSLKLQYAEQLDLNSGSVVVNNKFAGAEATLNTDKHPETGEKRNPWATEKEMRCKVWKNTLFLGKNGHKNTYRRRYDCINLR